MTQTETQEEMKRLEAEQIEKDRYRTNRGDEYETDGYFYRKSTDRVWTDSREEK